MPSKKTIYEFADFRADVLNKSLSKDGVNLSVTPKVFDTLIVLIENAPNLVEKDVLMERIWHDRFVEESNLTFNIKMLRKILGDSASNPDFIETIPRRGYRFIAEVRENEPLENVHIDNSSNKKTNQSFYLIASAVIFAGLILVFAFYRNGFSLYSSAKIFQKIRLNRITSTGKTYFAIISPDGKYIAHIKDDGEKQSLWIRQSDESRDIEVVPPAVGRFWGITISPDSKSIFYTFWEMNQANAALFQVPILGGASKNILQDITSGISFSPEGNKIAFYRTSASHGISQLFISNTDGSEETLVAERKSPDTFETNFGVPVWHPEEKKLIAIGASNTPGIKNELLEIEIGSGRTKIFAKTPWKEIYQIAWLKSTNGLLAIVFDEKANSMQISHVDPRTGESRKISDDLNNYQGISLSNDESILLTTQTEHLTKLLVTENETVKEVLSETGSISGKEGFGWTPDNHLVFRAENLGGNDIWIDDENGKKQLTFDSQANRHPTICGDGKYIVYASNQTETLRLWKMALDGKNKELLSRGENETEMFPHCSAKGDWVVFQRGWRRPTLWKIPISGGEPIQLSKILTLRPTLSPDGKMIAAYQLEKDWRLSIISAEDGTILQKFPVAPSVTSRNSRWTPDGKNIAYTDTRNGVSNIWLQPIDGGEPRQLTNFDSELIFYFDWSPDYKKLAYYRGTVSSNVIAISNLE